MPCSAAGEAARGASPHMRLPISPPTQLRGAVQTRRTVWLRPPSSSPEPLTFRGLGPACATRRVERTGVTVVSPHAPCIAHHHEARLPKPLPSAVVGQAFQPACRRHGHRVEEHLTRTKPHSRRLGRVTHREAWGIRATRERVHCVAAGEAALWCQSIYAALARLLCPIARIRRVPAGPVVWIAATCQTPANRETDVSPSGHARGGGMGMRYAAQAMPCSSVPSRATQRTTVKLPRPTTFPPIVSVSV